MPSKVLLLAPFLALGALSVAVTELAGRRLERPAGWYTRDPATALGTTPDVGLVSNLGIVLLCAAATSLLLAAAVVQRRGEPSEALPLWAIGGLTGLVALDDLFLLHEYVAPTVFRVREEAVYAGYVLAALAVAWRFRSFLRHTRLEWLAVAGLLLAGSSAIDLRQGGEFLLEDALKFLGLIAWAAYAVHTAVANIELMLRRAGGGVERTPEVSRQPGRSRRRAA